MKPLDYASLFSGLEAATLAVEPLGWRCAFVSEIDKAPCALLQQRHPNVPNYGDVNNYKDWPLHAVEVIFGGSPCQAFSVAGLRKGLADPRGNLMLTFGAVVARYRPRWFLWENVPGVLSSNEGRDFAGFLGLLSGQRVAVPTGGWQNSGVVAGYRRAYGLAYRVLDAQFFGLAQRRQRVFVVGHIGDWRPPAAVLFEPESLRGDSPPSREAREGVAATITGSTGGCSGKDDPAGRVPLEARNKVQAVAFDPTQITSAQNRSNPQAGEPCHTLAKGQHPPAIAYQTSGNCGAWETGPITGALDTNTDPNSHVVAFSVSENANGYAWESDVLQCRAQSPSSNQFDGIRVGYAVRRLTPLECERLQGIPDDYTNIAYRGRNTIADGPRYRMIGNSWAVPVVRWICERIQLVHDELNKAEAA